MACTNVQYKQQALVIPGSPASKSKFRVRIGINITLLLIGALSDSGSFSGSFIIG